MPRAKPQSDTEEICTLRIELCDTDPLVWREVEVPTAMTLVELHQIVQITMQWENSHLFQFTIAHERYGIPMDDDDDDWGEPCIHAGKTPLRAVLNPRRTTFDYLYDFGDSWEHRLIVTRIRPGEPGVSYPPLHWRRTRCPAGRLRRDSRLLRDAGSVERPRASEPRGCGGISRGVRSRAA